MFRNNDKVTLDALVAADQTGGSVLVVIEGSDSGVVVSIDATCVKLVHRHFNVGDSIYSDDGETSGVVMAVNGDWLWIQPSNGRAPRSVEAKYCEHDDIMEEVAS